MSEITKKIESLFLNELKENKSIEEVNDLYIKTLKLKLENKLTKEVIIELTSLYEKIICQKNM